MALGSADKQRSDEDTDSHQSAAQALQSVLPSDGSPARHPPTDPQCVASSTLDI